MNTNNNVFYNSSILILFNKVKKNKPHTFHDAPTFEKSYLTDMIQELIDQKILVKPIIVSGYWCEIDTLQDLENARKKYN